MGKKLWVIGWIAIACLLMAIPVLAGEQARQKNTIKIFEDQAIMTSGASPQPVAGYLGGTSTYIVDLKSPRFYEVLGGSFSLQFSGLTGYALESGVTPILVSGVTVALVTVQQANTLTGLVNSQTGEGVSAGLLVNGNIKNNLRSLTVLSNMDVASGNTEYNHGFSPANRSRYLIINVTSGITNIWINELVLDMY